MSDPAPIADGLDHQLDPRVIPLDRITGGITVAIMSMASLLGITIALLVGDDIPYAVRLMLPILWATLALLGAWHAYRWPPRSYAHMFYRIDDEGIEIRRGVHWRTVINIPKSRVQHIDVSQGPVERRYGLGTLIIYTAGTDHAKVELGGLEHGRALAIREHLLPRGTSDAV
ncbi:MAG TPA: PH domain-containing protein [Vicinamibacterales bacterium]|nr:PH domain-containing protein [Vicinamibacterales bacterium]